jgi:hypothetical protein
MRKTKQGYNETRQNFLLTFFEDKRPIYEEKKVNGFWLIKHLNGNTGKPEIAIFTPEALIKSRYMYQKKKLT